MDAEGLDAVTMRRIGRELGVEAMSLYNHVKDKEDILDSICQEVVAEFQVPGVDDWAEALRAGAREYRRLLLEHRNVITLMSERKAPFTNVESLRAYEFALDVFRRAGLSPGDSIKAFHVLGGYLVGFVTMELGLMVGGPHDEAHARAHQEMAQMVASADLPCLKEALPHFVEFEVDEQFEFGLDLIVDGLRCRVAGAG
jgi:AcrR family transcriptional regulator